MSTFSSHKNGRCLTLSDNVPDNVPDPYVVCPLKGDRQTTYGVNENKGCPADNQTTYNVPVNGGQHFSIWLRRRGVRPPRFIDHWEHEPWPEFDPAVHYDVTQPSQLQGLCTGRLTRKVGLAMAEFERERLRIIEGRGD
jgi:hypothetical protein